MNDDDDDERGMMTMMYALKRVMTDVSDEGRQ